MRSRVIPVGIAFTFTDQNTILHIEGKNKLFPSVGRNSTFADDEIYVSICVSQGA
jgi:hypothetical protein